MARVVRCFLRHCGRVLLVRPSDAAGSPGREDASGSDAGRWDTPTGRVDDTDHSVEAAARRVLHDAVGPEHEVEFVRAGRPLAGDTKGGDAVHPILFEGGTRDVAATDAFDAVEWVDPTAIRTRETAPRLWTAWRRVGPTVETVRDDRTHGSAWIAARALEVLRDAAVEAETWDDVDAVARDLRTARPAMAAVANAVDRAVAAAGPVPADPTVTVDGARSVLDDVLVAGERAGRVAATRLLEGDSVATLSRSGTVREAVAALSPARVVVAESRPEREGVGVAEWAAAETDAAVTLTTEAGFPTALARAGVAAVLVGADAITPDGDVVNKTGTRVLALAAREAAVPVYVAASTLKIRPAGDGSTAQESEGTSPTEAIYDGDADVSVHAPTFEVVPAALVDGVATEAGVLDADGIRAVAERHAGNAAWAGRTPE